MGLDQYLTKKTYVKNWNHTAPKDRHEITVTQGGFPHPHIKPERVEYIIEEIGYWRKANQIHKWFVNNVQEGNDDCGKYYVSHEKLQELLDLCKQVKNASKLVPAMINNGATLGENNEWVPIKEQGETIEDASVAHELLPCTEGFFFGSTDYDQYYMADIDNTIEILEAALKEPAGECNFYYSSSW